jgi:transcriptional regulator with XRE-family HTH domain
MLNKEKKGIELITGAMILHLRSVKNMTQTELAQKSGVSTAYISHLENDIRKMTFKTAVKIAKGLGVDYKVLADSPVKKRAEELGLPIESYEKYI